MRCPTETQEGTERLLAYGARGIERRASAVLQEHINTCRACRDFVAGQRAVWSALDEWEPPPISPGFDVRLYERIGQDVAWHSRLFQSARMLVGGRRWAVVAAACLVLMVGLILQRSAPVTMQPVNTPIGIVYPEQVVHALDDMEMLDDLDPAQRAENPNS